VDDLGFQPILLTQLVLDSAGCSIHGFVLGLG